MDKLMKHQSWTDNIHLERVRLQLEKVEETSSVSGNVVVIISLFTRVQLGEGF